MTTFLRLTSRDHAAIARAEQQRREAIASARPEITAAQRSADAADWHAISRRAAFFDADRRARMFASEDETQIRHLADTVARTARAALRKWREGGKPGGDVEARAFLLFALARKFAELMGDPCPYVDADGNIYTIAQGGEGAA